MNTGWCERTLDAIDAGILILDERGLVGFANRPACSILGRQPEDLLNAPIESILAPLPRLRQRNVGTGKAEIEVTLKDGASRSIGADVSSYLDECVGAERHVCMFQDITQLVELRRERDRLLQYATLNQILPGVLHELRNPLASADAMLQILVEEAQGSLQQDLHALLGELRRMSLSLQGVGAVGQKLRSESNQVIDCAVEEAVRVMHGLAERAGVTLSTQIATMPLLPLSAPVLKAITFNLVDNAINACRAGGSVVVSAQLVGGAATESHGTALELVVTDNGCGMTSEVRQRCTELFFSTKPRGSGIGLALCERSVKEAGGRLLIQSQPGQGTRVTVQVPTGRS